MEAILNILIGTVFLVCVEQVRSLEEHRLPVAGGYGNTDHEKPVFKETSDMKNVVVLAVFSSLSFVLFVLLTILVIRCYRRKACCLKRNEPVEDTECLELEEVICRENMNSGADVTEPLIEQQAEGGTGSHTQ